MLLCNASIVARLPSTSEGASAVKISLFTFALVFMFGSPVFADNPNIEVWKSATCECCGNWVKHLEASGFDVTVHTTNSSLLDRVRKDAGVPDKLAACHTAKIDGYVIEGHVPGTDIKRLSIEKPDAIGLTVPGMPMGAREWSKACSLTTTTCYFSRKTEQRRSSQAIRSGRGCFLAGKAALRPQKVINRTTAIRIRG
jgi:hypothetical protein